MKPAFPGFRFPFQPPFLILASVAFVSQLTFGLTSTLFALYARTLGLTVQETGITLSALTAGAFLSGPLWGKIADRWGTRRFILAASCIGQGLFCLLTPLTANVLWLTILRFCYGFFLVAQAPVINDLLINHKNPADQARQVGTLNIARGVAFSLGCWLSGYFNEVNPALNFFLASAVAFLVSGTLVFLGGIDRLPATSFPEKKDKNWLFRKKTLLFFLPIFYRSCAVSALLFFLPLFWEKSGNNPSFIGMVIGISNLAQLAFFPIVGRACFTREKTLMRIIQIGHILSLFPFLIAPLFSRGWGIFLPQAFMSISWVYFYLGTTIATRKISVPSRQAEAMGWVETFLNLGGTLGPAAFSLLLFFTGNSFPASFLLFSLLIAAAILTSRLSEKSLATPAG
ncbi:MAG TPA: MFS transporter [Atribacteraceae bacterium]|nr:MFS transporter [Atribacteraceae bacterium]